MRNLQRRASDQVVPLTATLIFDRVQIALEFNEERKLTAITCNQRAVLALMARDLSRAIAI